MLRGGSQRLTKRCRAVTRRALGVQRGRTSYPFITGHAAAALDATAMVKATAVVSFAETSARVPDVGPTFSYVASLVLLFYRCIQLRTGHDGGHSPFSNLKRPVHLPAGVDTYPVVVVM